MPSNAVASKRSQPYVSDYSEIAFFYIFSICTLLFEDSKIFVMFLKEVTYAHQGCIYLIKMQLKQ